MQDRNRITEEELELLDQVRPSIVERDGDRTVVYHPDYNDDDSGWVYLEDCGTVLSFGKGDHQTLFDAGLQRHYDAIGWVFDLIKKEGK